MKTVLLLLGLILSSLHFDVAQQSANIPRIAVLLSGSQNPFWVDSFRKALRELGYIEGKNIAIEYRNGNLRNFP